MKKIKAWAIVCKDGDYICAHPEFFDNLTFAIYDDKDSAKKSLNNRPKNVWKAKKDYKIIPITIKQP